MVPIRPVRNGGPGAAILQLRGSPVTVGFEPAGVAQLVERQLPKLNVDGSSPFTRFHPDNDETTALGSKPRAVPHRATRQKRSTPRLGLGRRTAEPDAAERLPAGTDSIRIGPSKGLRANSAPRWNRFQNREPDVSGSGLQNSRLFRNVMVRLDVAAVISPRATTHNPQRREKHQRYTHA